MLEQVKAVVADHAAKYPDGRVQVCQVTVEALDGGRLVLGGRVLEAAMLEGLRAELLQRFPELTVVDAGVKVLRQPNARVLAVATNLTGLYAGPSFLAEQLSQMLYGTRVEILEEQERWMYVRQMDGYLGWAYRSYLAEPPAGEATHLVAAPVSILRAAPDERGGLISRVLGGTYVQVLQREGAWAQIAAHFTGWVPFDDLRALADMPKTTAGRRAQVLADATTRLVGVPYLWGGGSAHGIDCSGFAQLVHRWSGVILPRDADMQCNVARPVEPPFQPGDLLFFGEKGDQRSITHVAISLGGWRIMHSSRTCNGVYEDDVQATDHLRDSFICAGTFLEG